MPDYHETIRKDWNERAEAWGIEGKPAPEFLDIYKEHEAKFGQNIIDIGCGKGRYLKFLAEKGKQTTGIDISEQMLEGAQQELKAAGLQASLVQGETSQMPFENESFDSAVSVGAIHHNAWEDIQRSFSEVGRVIKPGSIFIFQGRSIKDTMSQRQQVADYGYTAVDTEGGKKGIQHYFVLEELQQLADENGFEIINEPKEVLKKEIEGKVRARWWVVFKKKN